MLLMFLVLEVKCWSSRESKHKGTWFFLVPGDVNFCGDSEPDKVIPEPSQL